MKTIKNVSLVGPEAVKMNSSFSPDRRTVSLILEGAQIKDRTDAAGRYTSISFDLEISLSDIVTDESFSIDLRGGALHSNQNAFGVVRLQSADSRVILPAVEDAGPFVLSLGIDVKSSDAFRVSVLLLTNAGQNGQSEGESIMSADTIDIAFKSS